MNRNDNFYLLNRMPFRVCRLSDRIGVKQLTVAAVFILLYHAQSHGAFIESGGMVVMEAEHFQTSTSASGHAWIPANDVAGFVGTSAMRSTPNTGTTISVSIPSHSPGLTYPVQFTRTGNYKLWIRGWATSGSDDSVYLGVDGQVSPSLAYSPTGVWMWKAVAVTIPNPGTHQIILWMREDGAYVDRLLMTTNTAFTPTGNGPSESAQSGEGTNSPPVVQINNPTQGSSFPAGSTVSVSADASDQDGSVVSLDFYVNGAFVASDASAPFGFGWTPASGAYQLSAVATDNVGNSAASPAIDVTIAAPPPPSPVAGAFIESGGLVVMEAEHFQTSTRASGHAWTPTNGVAGFVGTSAMLSMPNTGTSISSSVLSNSPGLTYPVQITRTGNYKFWIRGWAANGSDDSVNLGVDDLVLPSLSYSQTAVWMWKAATVTITNPGPHQIKLWMREDGAYVDRLLMTTNAAFTPTGDGPPESAQSGGETNPPPAAVVADFAGAPTNGVAPLTVTFTNQSSGATNYTWTFGEGMSSAVVNPSNSYSNAGTYTVTLSAVGAGGTNVLTHSNYIVVNDPPPVAVVADFAGAPTNGVAPLTVTFTNQSSGATNYTWTFGDGNSSAAENPSYTFSNAGMYSVTLSAVGVGGTNVLTRSNYIVVNDPPPAAVVADFAGAPTNGVAPLTVTFTNQSSGATNYTWTFGDGNSSAAENPSYTFSNAGTYSVTLSAAGAGGTNVLTRTDYIAVSDPPPPIASFRWASSSQRIYVTGPGSATLSQIKTAVPSAPLTLVDPANAVWYLGANLFVENGAQLKLYGPAIDGDVAELRLKSENTSASIAIVELRVDWGWLDIRNTKIMSWDNAVNGPDTETDTYRRAYVRARSTLDPDGVTAHESRMDVINSEICYLGSHNSEAYGLTWKVVDTTAVYLPPGSTNTLFDVVNVYGDILKSRLHHNYFGMYSYGHYGGQWINNEVDNNVHYGFDPHDDSDYLVIENNNVHHNGWHGIIASKRCDHGVMRNNVSWNNGLDLVDPHGHGIMLHRSSNDWVVEGNQSYGNADTGISIFASDRTLIRNNICLSNANAGIRLTVGSADNWVEGNDVGGAHRYGLYLFEGDDPPEPDDGGGVGSGRCHGNTFTNNYVYDCTSDAIKLNDADRNAFLGNAFIGNHTTLRFENGADNLFAGNAVPADTSVKLIGTSASLNSTTFKSQPRLTLQLDPYSKATLADDEGAIFDFDQDVVTVADGAGSFVSVTSAQVGAGANTVLTRNFFVVPDSAGVLVNPTTWNQSGTFSKVWTAQASSGSIQVNYVVGDLQPGVSYRVNQGSTLLTTITADAQGYISFPTIPGTTTTLTYSVSPP